MKLDKLEWSAIATVIGILVLFSMAVAVTLYAPSHIDPTWKEPTCQYQVQMYEISDPNVYVSTSNPGSVSLQYVYHLKKGFTLMAYQEGPLTRILAPPELEPYVTRYGEKELKLTSDILLLRKATDSLKEEALQTHLQAEWKKAYPEKASFPRFEILELYDPQQSEAFAITESDGVIEHWAESDFQLIGAAVPYATDEGVIYVKNPKEYRISEINYLGRPYWVYQEGGEQVKDLSELKGERLKFISRQSLIAMGEDIYRVEGCWYCHTDQTRTLVQDTVLNGSQDYPAPPSSANEYVYQRVTFPGTRRIGPDLSRVGIKRANRDWHMSHFWSPKTESRGSLMPSFKHFFDHDPTGTSRNPYGIPNYKFEAIYHYLMTHGTRITPPSQGWWIGKDPIQTIKLIEEKK